MSSFTQATLDSVNLTEAFGQVGLEAMHPTLGRVHIVGAEGWKRKVMYETKSDAVHDVNSDTVFFDVEMDEVWVHALELKTFNFERDFA